MMPEQGGGESQELQYKEVFERAAAAPPTPVKESGLLNRVLNRLNLFRKREIYPGHYETDKEYGDALQMAVDERDGKKARHHQS